MEYINGITKNEYNNTKETKDQEDSYDKDNCSEDESSEEEDNESSDESSEEEDNESSEESSEEEDNESSEESSEEGDNESSEEEDNENLDREYDKYMSCSNKKKENLRYKTKFVEENGGKKIAIIKVGDKEESEYVGIMSEKGREIIEKYGSREDRYILEISKNNSDMRKILKEGATYEELLKMCYECYIKDIDILYIYIGRWV